MRSVFFLNNRSHVTAVLLHTSTSFSEHGVIVSSFRTSELVNSQAPRRVPSTESRNVVLLSKLTGYALLAYSLS